MMQRLWRPFGGAPGRFLVPLLLAASPWLFSGCHLAPEPSAQERRSSFRTQRRAFTGDSAQAILQTCLVIAAGPDSPEPALDPKTGTLSVPPSPDGTYTQGLSVGVDARGYLLTAGHVLRERNFVIGWIDGRLEIQPARVLFRSSPGESRADLAVIRVDGKLDYCAHFGRAPARNDPVFAVVCDRSGAGIGGELDLAGGTVLGGGRDSSGGLDPVISTDVPLWHGDSGGPLLSGTGDLVGVNSAIEFTWFGRREILGGYRRLSYFPDAGLVRRVIAADEAKAAARGAP